MNLFVCSHLRPVVQTAAGWKHLSFDGIPERGGPCEAGVYRLEMEDSEIAEQMTMQKLMGQSND